MLKKIAELQKKKSSELGRKLADISEVNIPIEDPFEEGWILAPDGVIRSNSSKRGV